MKLLGISTDDLQNPQMANLFVTRAVMLLATITLAIMVGYWVGTGQNSFLFFATALIVVAFVTFGMQRNAWILIPLTWLLTGSIGKLPLPFAVRDLGVLLAVCSYAAYRALSHENLRPKPHMLDLLVGVNVIYLALNLFKNPVGFAIFGSQTIGARPLLNISIALLAYWVIIRLPGSVVSVSRIPHYMLVSAAFLSSLHVLLYVFPQLTPTLTSWYSGLDYSAYLGLVGVQQEMQRLKGLSSLGIYLLQFLCAMYPPATLFDPRRGRFYSMLLAGICILASGFRNMFVWALASLGISGWLHRRWREVAGAAAIGTIALALLVLGQGRLYELPRTVQRSLAFLPGKWSEVVIADAESSSTWRFQLWKDVIDQGLIKDWWLGDGFGANLQDLLATLHASSYTDFATLTGSYHSGPLTAIRFVGIIGLVLLYVLTISAAWYAYQCVNECRGTILFPVAVFMAIQLIWWPIHYTFVFGGYDGYLPDTIFQIAILRLLIRLSEQMKEQALARARTPEATLPSAAGVSA